MKLAFAFSLLPLVARADYPSELTWASCGSGSSLCATLEFCGSGSTYGYRLPGDTTHACGSVPGPLIRMTPGNTYKLTLHNAHDDSSVSTNVHTHGLHIVGDGDSDSVFRSVESGSCLEYTWDISSEHPGGTYWYHPHLHKYVNAQVSGGAFGMLIIDDTSDSLGSWATNSDNEKLLLISNAGSLLANGSGNEVVYVEPDKWYRLRVSAVVPGAQAQNLSFNDSTDSCTVYKVASDGVWHSNAFSNNNALTDYAGSSFEISGASRADFAIKCSTGTTTIKWVQGIAATIESGVGLDGGHGMSGDNLALGSAPFRPTALQNIATATPFDTFVVQLSGGGINQQKWDENDLVTGLGDIEFDEVHEWTLKQTGAHPFHLHLYHMLIVEPGGCGAHEYGEFYDTISAQGDCKVRFKTADFGQRMVLHCHVLNHEDSGAINWLNVGPIEAIPNSAVNNVDSPSYTCSSNAPPSPSPPSPSPPSPTPPSGCIATGESGCGSDAECCSNNCRANGSCGNPPPGSGTDSPTLSPITISPTNSPTKKPTAFPTSAPPTNNPTKAPTSCVDTGGGCSVDGECCSNDCRGFTCRSGGGFPLMFSDELIIVEQILEEEMGSSASYFTGRKLITGAMLSGMVMLWTLF